MKSVADRVVAKGPGATRHLRQTLPETHRTGSAHEDSDLCFQPRQSVTETPGWSTQGASVGGSVCCQSMADSHFQRRFLRLAYCLSLDAKTGWNASVG